MPSDSASRRASAAGSWPGSSPSGRLLMIVRTPAFPSASMSARSSLPAALRPGASSAKGGREGGDDGGMARLRSLLRVNSQPAAAPSLEKSGGVLPRALDQIASPDPKSLQPAQREARRLQILIGDGRLRQHLDVPLMHIAEPLAQC